MLLKKGAGPDIRDSDGRTPLLLTAESDLPAELVMRLATDPRVQINSRDNQSLTPLSWAYDSHSRRICIPLLKGGGRVWR
ncbi:hypothetical protein BDW59DRAFT_12209 [Aspergillus cavernicola]|uniref:Ankyrin repeat-containing domain protein n=1 Tax=Aspergillus cavernicola TaxID=176166 RepID=A0ABR4HMX6_9EURO